MSTFNGNIYDYQKRKPPAKWPSVMTRQRRRRLAYDAGLPYSAGNINVKNT